MARTIGFALLVDMEDTPAPIDNGIYCFETANEAEEFAAELLVQCGWCKQIRAYWKDQEGTLLVSPAHVLNAFRSELGVDEFFCVREVKEKPQNIG